MRLLNHKLSRLRADRSFSRIRADMSFWSLLILALIARDYTVAFICVCLAAVVGLFGWLEGRSIKRLTKRLDELVAEDGGSEANILRAELARAEARVAEAEWLLSTAVERDTVVEWQRRKFAWLGREAP